MADVLSWNLMQGEGNRSRGLAAPDLSTGFINGRRGRRSFGEQFADRNGPKVLPCKHVTPPAEPPRRVMITAEVGPQPKATIYRRFLFAYKKTPNSPSKVKAKSSDDLPDDAQVPWRSQEKEKGGWLHAPRAINFQS